MAIVTCRTPECANENIPIETSISFVDDEGNTVYVSVVFCGVCGNPITDIDPPIPEPPPPG